MIVTALAPIIGYNLAGEIAKKADKEETTLKEAFISNIKAQDALKAYFKQDLTEEQILCKY